MRPLPKPFVFNVVNTQTISGVFQTLSGKSIIVDWGDGTRKAYTGTTEQAYSKDYGSAGNRTVKVFNAAVMTRFTMIKTGANITFNLRNLPAGLTYFLCTGSNTITGDIANLPAGLTDFICYGSNTITGDIADLKTGLTDFRCTGSSTITGDIANLPAGLTIFECQGSNTITGDIADLPAGLTTFYCTGSNTIDTYSGKTWTTKPATFILIPTGVGGLDVDEVNQLLIDFDDDLTWATGNKITLTGTNAAPNATSADAIASIRAEGATVEVNS